MNGLYALLSSEVLPLSDFAEAARALAAQRVDTLQVRAKDLPDRERLAVQRAVASALEGYGGLLVVNDRADLAYVLAVEYPDLQVGLHLGQDDVPPSLARAVVGPGVPIGLSTHNLDQVRAARAEPVDYIAFGPIYHTTTKQRPDPIVGIEGLRAACRMSDTPVVAIGGITPERARAVYKAGAAAVAVASGLFVKGAPLGEIGARAAAYRAAREPSA